MFDPALFNVVKEGGAIAVLVVVLWLLYTERLVPSGRLKDATARTEKAEAQRDEAVAGWKQQADATKQIADQWTQAVRLVRRSEDAE